MDFFYCHRKYQYALGVRRVLAGFYLLFFNKIYRKGLKFTKW